MIRVLIILLLGLGVLQAQADVETTTVLPQGVFSSKFTLGIYSGLDDRYNSSALIEGVADQYHINLTGSSLSKMNPALEHLVGALNHLSPNERLGDELSMGTLNFKSSPVIETFIPTLCYGLTSDFTIGIGIPIIHFHNSMQVSSSGNASAVAQFVKNTNPDLDDAINQLVAASSNLAGSINSVLATKGYKPIRDLDFMAPGDLQVSGLYRYRNSSRWRLALRPFIQFPTGRPDDPDDLVDVATGGQPAIGAYSIHEYIINNRWALVSSVGYQANIQDTIQARVPIDSDDVLPGLDRRETVRRKTGNSLFLEGGGALTVSSSFEIRGLYDFTEKDPDWYDGDHGWDYSLLSADTGSQIHQFKALFEYSTVDLYRSKKFSMPLLIGYIFGDTFYAINAPTQLSNQLYLRMFF